MSLISPEFFKSPQHHGARVSRLLCATLSLLFLTAVPAFAEPVTINQVVQTLSSSQGAPDLKLNNLVSQDPAQKGGAPQTGPRSDNGPASQGGIKTDSLISGVTTVSQTQTLGVETIEEGEVEGTICDCGEIFIAGGIPKWPFLLLAAVPLAFIHTCDDCDTPSSTPTPTPPSIPTPTPPGVPEPASLLLFGTGLAAAAAGLRRRYGMAKLNRQIEEE